jgi:regulator of extracellular matrix RemA (YlzA/DUF370 family)
MPTYTYQPGFMGVNTIGEHLYMSQIENNIKSFLDNGLLNIGAFINVNKPQNNIYGNNIFKLKPTEDPNYNTGQVWQTMRKDWIWESGISFEPTPLPSADPGNVLTNSPNNIDGIYINDVSYPLNTTGQYAYKVDYINSRVIFNNPISVNSDVGMEYAYRWCQVYTYDNARWWQQLQYKTDQNAKHFNQLAEGDFSIFSNNRIQLPAIIIESVSRGLSRPYQLGDKSLIMKQELLLHIVADNMADRNKLIDILRIQQDRVLIFYDTNLVVQNHVQPFNIDGTLNSNRKSYIDLVNDVNYRWNQGRLLDIYASNVQSFSPFLAESNVHISVEIIMGV